MDKWRNTERAAATVRRKIRARMTTEEFLEYGYSDRADYRAMKARMIARAAATAKAAAL